MDRQKIIKDIVVCTNCHSDVVWSQGGIECDKCKSRFSIKNGIPNFVGYDIEKTKESQFQSEQMLGNTFTGMLYNIGKKVISSEYMPKNHVKDFVGRIMRWRRRV